MCRDIERWEVNEVQMPGKKIEPQWLFLDTLPLSLGEVEHVGQPCIERHVHIFHIAKISAQA